MLKTALAVLFAVVLAIGGAAASLSYVLADPVGGARALTIGPWTAFPEIGAPDADPYSRARVAREGVLALGTTEGVAFTATRDSQGRPLRLECSYRVDGVTPAARFWTLFAAGGERSAARGVAALNSQTLLRRPDNSFAITVAGQASPGNWLRVAGSGPMALVLTVYDSTVATGAELAQATMPRIVPLDCNV